MAPGGAELGPATVADGCAAEGVFLPLWAPCEQPVMPDKPVKAVATTSAPHRGGR